MSLSEYELSLAAEAKKGKKKALDRLYDALHKTLCEVIDRELGDRSRAEMILRSVFDKLKVEAIKMAEPAQFEALAIRLTEEECKNHPRAAVPPGESGATKFTAYKGGIKMPEKETPQVQQTVPPTPPIRQTASPTPPIRQTAPPTPPVRQTAPPTPPVRQTAPPAPPIRQTAPPAPPIRQTAPPTPPIRQTAPPTSPVRQTASPTPPVRQTAPPTPPVRQTAPPTPTTRQPAPPVKTPAAPPQPTPPAATASDSVKAWLVCVFGFDKGKNYPIKDKVNTIGGSLKNDIQVNNEPGVAQFNHANIVYNRKNGECTLDIGAGGKICVNGTEYDRPRVLKKFDVINVGNAQFVFAPYSEGLEWTKDFGL